MDIYEVNKSSDFIKITFSSSLKNVDIAVKEITDYLKLTHEKRKTKNNECLFETSLILHEALTNAVMHGNKEDITKVVRVETDSLFTRLQVADEGDGFDWRAVNYSAKRAICKPGGRGLLIMNEYGFKITYNEKGNILYIVRKQAT